MPSSGHFASRFGDTAEYPGRVRGVVVSIWLAACGFENHGGTTQTSQPDAPAATADAMPDAPAVELCNSRYGTVERYDLCATTNTTCRFYAKTSGTCTALCASKGGTCESSHDGNCGSIPAIRSCDRSLIDQVCVCTQ